MLISCPAFKFLTNCEFDLAQWFSWLAPFYSVRSLFGPEICCLVIDFPLFSRFAG
jgi:hypothetical protein